MADGFVNQSFRKPVGLVPDLSLPGLLSAHAAVKVMTPILG